MQIKNSNVVYVNNKGKMPVFKAKEYAFVKTLVNETPQTLKVFSLDAKDTPFLEEMCSKINLKNLSTYKNATEIQLKRWKALISNAVTMTRFSSPQHTYLLTTEKNKPCAMISYSSFNQKTCLNALVAWPVKAGHNVKLAGSSLLKMLFEKSLNNSTKSIKADVMKNGPMDAVAFYTQRGFYSVKKEHRHGNDFEIKYAGIKKANNKLNSLIKIEKIENPQEVNLKSTLDISY